MSTIYKDWLEISTDGFAQRQADRKPEHLMKEIIQNALDATEGIEGRVEITINPSTVKRKKCVELIVEDNGPGITDASDLRTVFSTGKTDSFFLRGRLGQGFKEILCLCLAADVYSTSHRIRFYVEAGERKCKVENFASRKTGTCVTMWLPWDQDAIPNLKGYVLGLVAPVRTTVIVNGQEIPKRPVAHTIGVSLQTELFQDGRWLRRVRPGTLDLVPPAFPGERPTIFEMGIPVQEIDWTQPYHINVQMRVPMNPRRDAVAAGYLKDVFRQVLPLLMPKLQPEELRDEWVSLAVEDAEPELRRNVVVNAFGADAVRSVPTMGRHDWDSDAREIGFKPIETALLPRGLREAAQENMKTSREAEMGRRETLNVVWQSPVTKDADGPVKAFIAWLAGEMIDMPVDVRVVPELVINGRNTAAGWSRGGRLQLSETHRSVWMDPLDEDFLGLLVHEVSHEDAAHHGDDFRKEVEHMAGKLAKFCLNHGNEIDTKYREMEDAIKKIQG